MARLDNLIVSPCIDWSLMGNSFYTFVQLQFITIGISVFCVACFWGYCLGELPRSWDYFASPRFWMFREFNPNLEDQAKQEYMGYGIGSWPFIIILITWFLQLLQPFCQYFASTQLYPEEWYWVYHLNALLYMGVANMVQWTWEHEPITTMVGNDRMMAFIVVLMILGLYVY